MSKPRICGVITGTGCKPDENADLYEVRIDLLGEGWRDVVPVLNKPWIACCRMAEEGGSWNGAGQERINLLMEAVELGATIVDIELRTNNIRQTIASFSGRAQCLVSYHDFTGTPAPVELEGIVRRQIEAGADICKVVTTARMFEDNLTVLRLPSLFPERNVVSFAMGEDGITSRVLAPLARSYCTYASLEKGMESAPGQITVRQLRELYRVLGHDD